MFTTTDFAKWSADYRIAQQRKPGITLQQQILCLSALHKAVEGAEREQVKEIGVILIRKKEEQP